MADGDVQDTLLILKIQDTGNQKSRATFGADSTVTLAKAFMAKYSSAKITGAGSTDRLECAAVEPENFDESDTDDKLLITARDTVTGELVKFVISSYFESENLVLESGPEGKRLNSATGTTICADWKTANALDNALAFLSGTPVRRA
jgi:hypothetical protein